MEAVKSNDNKLSIQRLATIGVMTAVLCILAPMSIPIGPIPISLTNLVIYISLYVLGLKKTGVSYLVYLLIGLVGVPVFSGFSGGVGKLFGPTGGYLIGFIPMALIAGVVIDKITNRWYLEFFAMLAGTCVAYLFGTCWLAYQAHMSFEAALWAGVIPFIPGDVAKMVIALLIGPAIRKRLTKAKVI